MGLQSKEIQRQLVVLYPKAGEISVLLDGKRDSKALLVAMDSIAMRAAHRYDFSRVDSGLLDFLLANKDYDSRFLRERLDHYVKMNKPLARMQTKIRRIISNTCAAGFAALGSR